MEPRKIIKLGNSSFAIALPKDWVDKSGLKKGDHIYVSRNGHGELIVAPGQYERSDDKIKRVELILESKKSLIHELRSAYVQDNDVVEISGVTRDNKQLIRDIIEQELMGFELIEHLEGKMVIKDFFNIREVKLESFLRKIDNSIRSMFEDLIIFISRFPIKDKDLEDINKTDLEINKLYLLTTRIFFKGLDDPSVLNLLNVDSKELFSHWWITFHFEHIADEIKKIARLFKSKESKKIDLENLSKICKIMQEGYIKTLNGYYKNDKNLSKESLESTENLRKIIGEVPSDGSGWQKEVFVRLFSINKSIYEINKILMYNSI